MELSITEISIVGGLLAILAAGAKGVWVWGWHHQECVTERDRWKALALKGTELAERQAEIMESQHR